MPTASEPMEESDRKSRLLGRVYVYSQSWP